MKTFNEWLELKEGYMTGWFMEKMQKHPDFKRNVEQELKAKGFDWEDLSDDHQEEYLKDKWEEYEQLVATKDDPNRYDLPGDLERTNREIARDNSVGARQKQRTRMIQRHAGPGVPNVAASEKLRNYERTGR